MIVTKAAAILSLSPTAQFVIVGDTLDWISGPQPTDAEISAEMARMEEELPRQAMSLSFAQLLTGLVAEAWITEAEGQAWLQGVLPVAVTSLIATLPPEQQFGATARATVPSAVNRMDPLVIALGTAQGKTPEEIDTFFLTYANV